MLVLLTTIAALDMTYQHVVSPIAVPLGVALSTRQAGASAANSTKILFRGHGHSPRQTEEIVFWEVRWCQDDEEVATIATGILY